jgi:hypothetical protein
MKSILALTAVIFMACMAQADIANPPVNEKKAPVQFKSAQDMTKEELQKMRAHTKAACAAEIAKTGCKQEPGQGLMLCLNAYRKTNKFFQISEKCRVGSNAWHGHAELKKAQAAAANSAPAAPSPQAPKAPATQPKK